MIKPNNFKEIRVTPNEDGTYKVVYYGVVFQDKDGKQLEPATITYHRVKVESSSFYLDPTKEHLDIEILSEYNKEMWTICIQEE